MKLARYRHLDFYSDLSSTRGFIGGQNTELWISKEGRQKDTHFKVEPFAQAATTITIKAIAEKGRFYKRDIFTIFSEGEKESEQILLGHLILNQSLDFLKNQSYEVSICPSSFESQIKTNGYCSCLIPVLSIKDGGLLLMNSVIAEAQNKNQLSPIKRVVARSAEIDFNGIAVMEDDALALLYALSKGKNNLYYEIRYNSAGKFNIEGMDYTLGRGPGAYRGRSTVNFSLAAPSDDFIKANCNMEVGRISNYELDYEFLFTKFCPINLDFFYAINYNLEILSGVIDGFCPINLSELYEFA